MILGKHKNSYMARPLSLLPPLLHPSGQVNSLTSRAYHHQGSRLHTHDDSSNAFRILKGMKWVRLP